VPDVSIFAYKKATYDDIKNSSTEDLKSQIEALNDLMEATKQSLSDAEALQKDATEKRELYLTLEALYNDTITAMEDELTFYEGEIADCEQKSADLQQKYDDKYEEFQQYLAMIYEQGNPNFIEIIAGASSFSDLLSRIDRQRALVSYIDTMMNSLSDQKDEIDGILEQQQKLAEEKAESIKLYEEKQAELATWKKENEAAIAAIESEIEMLLADSAEYAEQSDILDDDFQKMVAQLEKTENAKRAAAEKKAQEEAAAAAEAARLKALEEAARGQKYLWPVPMNENVITYPFGNRLHPVYKKYQMHYGIDIAAPRGTPIYAAKSGKVTAATYHASYGYYVIIDHLDGTSTVYAHGLAGSIKVKKGQEVNQGQQIMSVGTTGVSTGYHLHFEVRYAGTCVDPLDSKKVPLITPSTLVKRY